MSYKNISCLKLYARVISNIPQIVKKENNILYNDIISINGPVKFDKDTGNLLINSIGTFLIMYKIHDISELIQIALYSNNKLCNISISKPEDKNIFDMCLVEIKNDDLILINDTYGAVLKTVNKSYTDIHINDSELLCIEVNVI
jgi:hypothetical protein